MLEYFRTHWSHLEQSLGDHEVLRVIGTHCMVASNGHLRKNKDIHVNRSLCSYQYKCNKCIDDGKVTSH